MMYDRVETISRSVVQHGPNNDRVYLMKISDDEQVDFLIDQLHNLTILKRYSKIFAKVPSRFKNIFLAHKFKAEAYVPGLFGGKENGIFFSKYFNAKRGYLSSAEREVIKEVIALAGQSSDLPVGQFPKGYRFRRLDDTDIPAITGIYKKVFSVYPFPVFDEQYLAEVMHSHVKFYGLEFKGKLIAVSSAEMDSENSNAEMTDFATIPDHRGKNLSYYLLGEMIGEMKEENMKTVYTIARAHSVGMNKTFGRHDFQFGGTLIKNTLIGESIESMNVWYRRL